MNVLEDSPLRKHVKVRTATLLRLKAEGKSHTYLYKEQLKSLQDMNEELADEDEGIEDLSALLT